MLLRLLKAGQLIPAGSDATSILDLRIYPQDGAAYMMFSGNQILVTRGRVTTAGSGLTSIQPKQSQVPWGEATALEANIGAAISTSLITGMSHGMPYFRLLQAGTSSADSQMDFVLGLGFPVSRVEVLAVRAGLYPYVVGQNIVTVPGVVLAW